MYTSGIDQHKRDSVITTYDAAGQRVRQARLPNRPAAVIRYFAAFRGRSCKSILLIDSKPSAPQPKRGRIPQNSVFRRLFQSIAAAHFGRTCHAPAIG